MRTPLKIGLLLACMLAAGMAGCKRYNGSQTVHYTQFPEGATEMNLRWPEIPGQAPAVHFRIPRDDVYLDTLVGDKPGEVDRVSLKIRIPEQLARDLFTARQGRGKFPEPHPDRPYLKSVELLRLVNNEEARKDRFDQWSFKCMNSVRCVLDGSVGELVRYSEIMCPGPPPKKETLMHSNDANEWQKRILVPEGCKVLSVGQYLSNSTNRDRGEEGIDIECIQGCQLYVQVQGRKLRTSLRLSQIKYAQELADIMRNQVKNYVE